MVLNEMICNNDLLNKLGERNIKNMDKNEYNCGGYALETFNWYCPYPRELRDDLFDSWYGEYNYEQTMEICVEHMLKEFEGDLRVIQDISELKENEYAIAFRIAESDFHYTKRFDNGNWFHKMGARGRIDRMKKSEVFGEEWCYRYDSEITLFAKKKNKNLIN